MHHTTENPHDPIPLWRARARLAGQGWSDAAYGFGGHDVAEAVGTPGQLGAELAGFLGGLDRAAVEAARARTGRLAVELEVEPHAGGTSTLAGMGTEPPAEDPVRVWEGTACVGNGRGVFDACYSFGNAAGDEAHLVGTAGELGAELARVLALLTRRDVEDMKYGTDRFFLQLVVEPLRQA